MAQGVRGARSGLPVSSAPFRGANKGGGGHGALGQQEKLRGKSLRLVSKGSAWILWAPAPLSLQSSGSHGPWEAARWLSSVWE